MPSSSDPTPPNVPNLNSDTEHVHRELYDLIVTMHFSPLPAESVGPGDYAGPTTIPIPPGLKVFYALGRWFATWSVMDNPGNYEHLATALVRVVADPDQQYAPNARCLRQRDELRATGLVDEVVARCNDVVVEVERTGDGPRDAHRDDETVRAQTIEFSGLRRILHNLQSCREFASRKSN
jgi:hypothetical protein